MEMWGWWVGENSEECPKNYVKYLQQRQSQTYPPCQQSHQSHAEYVQLQRSHKVTWKPLHYIAHASLHIPQAHAHLGKPPHRQRFPIRQTTTMAPESLTALHQHLAHSPAPLAAAPRCRSSSLQDAPSGPLDGASSGTAETGDLGASARQPLSAALVTCS